MVTQIDYRTFFDIDFNNFDFEWIETIYNRLYEDNLNNIEIIDNLEVAFSIYHRYKSLLDHEQKILLINNSNFDTSYMIDATLHIENIVRYITQLQDNVLSQDIIRIILNIQQYINYHLENIQIHFIGLTHSRL